MEAPEWSAERAGVLPLLLLGLPIRSNVLHRATQKRFAKRVIGALLHRISRLTLDQTTLIPLDCFSYLRSVSRMQ